MVGEFYLAKGHRAGGELRGLEPFIAVDWPEAIALVAGDLIRLFGTIENWRRNQSSANRSPSGNPC